ncbi:leucine dehydrogenase/phenylalanine dehydrogenase [Melghirimyces profundicolus]|uniref:Leucine dehydrogenase/phenylalanine dehydrogenase n=1 Tax=Melghirimyces profundicolus TaxID=1242148 RepID=A0A2T6C7G3_9BACL|nr:amino acid dehydrogenase [Melghirimyces profundicolus]PTX64233.1 leucine dehydrogenase/phenylalanine dehydrogenase [Melghirimyces profundicolus]
MKVLGQNHDRSSKKKLPEEKVEQRSRMDDIFELMAEGGHEEVTFCRHPGSGLKAIIAIHDTTMGPALGGCRMVPYTSTDEAVKDVLRLSRGMTFKCGLADVDFGGGKAVIIGDPETDKTPEMFRVLGRFVGGLNGRFFTGTDMGTMPEDFVHAARESDSFVGLPESHGGSGDTSIPTAYGVMQGFRATARHLWGTDSLEGRTVAIQGVGKVGARLAGQLVEEGARCVVADVSPARVESLKARNPDIEVTGVEEIHRVECDIFAPCAIGGVIHDGTLDELRCRAVVGSANNQLAKDRHGDLLHERGILYAPDYLVNAGGLIQVADELQGYHHERVMEKTRGIHDMLLKIYELSREEDLPTCRAADRLVLERLRQVADLKRIFLGFDRRG